MTAHRRAPRRATLATVITPLALLALASPALVACSSDSSESERDRSSSTPTSGGAGESSESGESGGSGGSSDSARESEPSPAPDSDGAESPQEAPQEGPASGAPVEPPEAAIIATGTVDLVADDVARARRDVQRVASEVQGQVSREETTTDADGVIDGSVLELRVPSDTFSGALASLEEIADIASSTRSLDDVSTEIVDTEARVRAQEASLTRIEALLSEAEDLTEIVAIEAELTRRQADLDSLSSQLAYLQGATAYSTITVYLERTEEAADEAPAEEDEGFLDGLGSGWDGLTTFASGLAVLLGVMLPWLGLALVVLFPAMWVGRRVAQRRRSDAGTGATADTTDTGATADMGGLPPRPDRESEAVR